MGEKPIWEQIGSSFVQHYYQLFDTDRTQLGAIYRLILDLDQIRFDKHSSEERFGPKKYQIDASCLTWEGQQFQGKAAIVEKLSTLPFLKIAHSITAQDHQPTPDSCIMSMVVGQLKADDDQVLGFQQTFLLKNYSNAWADEDPIMGFHQSFILKNINDAWVCTNDMFRLALHNFG